MSSNQLTEWISRQDWLEPVEEALANAVHRAFDSAGPTGKKVADFLHGTWLGHPLHPVITDVPIGSWTAAVLLDAASAQTGSRALERAADAAIAIGAAAAVDAAITGITDWHQTDGKARRIGLIHAALNTTSLLLYTTSLIMRRRRRRETGRKLAYAAYAISGTAAYLGGHLVYSEQIGVDHTAGREYPSEFTPVLEESKLQENKLTRADAAGVPVLLYRKGSRITAIAETCAHLGGPLSEGKIEDETVICPWHGSRYSLEDGRLINGPSVYPQPCFETRVQDGRIEVRMK